MTVTVYRVYIVAFVASLFAAHYVVGEQPPSNWKQHVINHLSPFEAAGVADFNQDGKLDVFSGDSWYAAPNWEAFKVREVPKGTEHLIDTPGSMETGYLLDLFKNGKPVFIPNVGGKVMFYELAMKSPKVEWIPHVLSPHGAGHGVGHGDINGDGRIDLITPRGWYEQPEQVSDQWTFHSDFELGTASIEIIGHDFDGDGLTDIVWGMGHDFGLFWLKQSTLDGKRTWTKEEIDMTFSQVHTLHLADFNGNGELEIVTPGKSGLYWFENPRENSAR